MADAPLFGRTVLVLGPETLFADRAVASWKDRVSAEQPDVEVTEVLAAELEPGQLNELTSGSLFSSHSAVVLSDLSDLPADQGDVLVALVQDTPADVALLVTHPGGVKGKGVLDKIKKSRCEVVSAEAIKPWEVEQFVVSEGRRIGLRIDADTAAALVAGVGNDPRSLSAALDQLVSDAGTEPVTAALVRRYFSGRAEMTGFAVADAIMGGSTSLALEKLRWSLSTGTAPVLITSAIASALRSQGRYSGARASGLAPAAIASAIGVNPRKVKELAARSRSWSDRRVADGIRLVAQADADIKGQAGAPDFTLERLVLALCQRPESAR